jgi:uridine kinase
MATNPDKTLGRVADHLLAVAPGHPLRVAVDGITAAGKTTFARSLVGALSARGRTAVHLSMDGFHHPRARRHRQGRDSAIGYYEDAYDFTSFADLVLAPLGPGGDRRYRARIIELASDQAVDEPPIEAATDMVLVVDGSFLQREPLRSLWDEVIYLDTGFAAARERGSRRDADAFGGVAAAQQAFDRRYHAASRMYVDAVAPADQASILVDNAEPRSPVLQRIGGTAGSTVSVFSYGTLQLAEVQLASFGRLLAGTGDALPGHRTEWVTITDPEVDAVSGSDRHPNVVPSDRPDEAVEGTLLTLTPSELAAADHYEVDDYRRRRVTLRSGQDAWAYLAG